MAHLTIFHGTLVEKQAPNLCFLIRVDTLLCSVVQHHGSWLLRSRFRANSAEVKAPISGLCLLPSVFLPHVNFVLMLTCLNVTCLIAYYVNLCLSITVIRGCLKSNTAIYK